MLSHSNPLIVRGLWGLLIVVALALLIAVRNVRCTGPYSLLRVLPRKVSRRPVLVWREGSFLGWGRNILGLTRWAFGSPEDTVAIIGPPRISGKTAGLIIPQAAMFDGALVTTSTKPDVLRATAGRRLELAARHGGNVYVYMPTAAGDVEGFTPIRWSPLAGCEDPLIAAVRVDALVSVAEVGKNVENADHWRAGAARILRAYFLAAAHHPTRAGDFAVVMQWLSLQEFREPLTILSGAGVEGADAWGADLLGIAERTNDKERSSFFAAASTALKVAAVPRVLRSCSGTDIDPAEFIRTRSTLYIISPAEYQSGLAPLCAALVESIVHEAYALHDAYGQPRGGQLVHALKNAGRVLTGQPPLPALDAGRPPRTLLQLDELTNIAPLPSLESIISQGAGRGVPSCWTVQSLAQLRNRYGDHAAEAIWSASTCKIIFGGLSDGPTLEHVSRLIGDQRVVTRTFSTDHEGKRTETRGHEWRVRLAPAQLRELSGGWTLLLYHQKAPRALRAPIAARRWRMRRALLSISAAARPAVTAQGPVVAMPGGAPVARPATFNADGWPVRPQVVRAEPAHGPDQEVAVTTNAEAEG